MPFGTLAAIAFEDVPYSTAFIMGDVTIPDFPLNPAERHTFFGKATYFVVMPSGDRFFRIVAIRLPGMRAAGDPSLEEFSRMLAICNGPRMTFTSARCLTHFYPRRAVAERLRRGRVFLAGDAAHIHPPVGALGLNTGVQDALNLAWKLAYVCRGLADDSLLESYHTERHAVAQRLVRDTDESTRRIIEASWSGRLRERIRWLAHCLPPLQIRMATRNTQLGVTYHREQNGLTGAVPGLFTGRVRTGDRAPLIRLPQARGGPLPFQLLMFAGSARNGDSGGEGRSSLVRLAGWARSLARSFADHVDRRSHWRRRSSGFRRPHPQELWRETTCHGAGAPGWPRCGSPANGEIHSRRRSGGSDPRARCFRS